MLYPMSISPRCLSQQLHHVMARRRRRPTLSVRMCAPCRNDSDTAPPKCSSPKGPDMAETCQDDPRRTSRRQGTERHPGAKLFPKQAIEEGSLGAIG